MIDEIICDNTIDQKIRRNFLKFREQFGTTLSPWDKNIINYKIKIYINILVTSISFLFFFFFKKYLLVLKIT